MEIKHRFLLFLVYDTKKDFHDLTQVWNNKLNIINTKKDVMLFQITIITSLITDQLRETEVEHSINYFQDVPTNCININPTNYIIISHIINI